MMHIDCMAEVGAVLGKQDSAGRSWDFARHAVMEDNVGSAGCRPLWGLGSWCRSSMEDPGRTG